MSSRQPHKQLKKIRGVLGITQMEAAAMLGVSYPYFLSVETGQRELSHPLARKIRSAFGVACIQDKNADPEIRDPRSGKRLPFTKERYQEYRSAPPSFFIDPEYTGERGVKIVTPNISDYARCTQALLEAAQERRTLRPVVADFFKWFAQSLSSGDGIFDTLKQKFDRLFPMQRTNSDAFLALTVNWWNIVEDEIMKDDLKKASAARRAAQKRKRRRAIMTELLQ